MGNGGREFIEDTGFDLVNIPLGLYVAAQFLVCLVRLFRCIKAS
jgi:hypothetical protein